MNTSFLNLNVAYPHVFNPFSVFVQDGFHSISMSVFFTMAISVSLFMSMSMSCPCPSPCLCPFSYQGLCPSPCPSVSVSVSMVRVLVMLIYTYGICLAYFNGELSTLIFRLSIDTFQCLYCGIFWHWIIFNAKMPYLQATFQLLRFIVCRNNKRITLKVTFTFHLKDNG
jgi:hypothetical protein